VADNQPSYLANLARQVGQGLSFGFSDEGEAALRALAQSDPYQYRAIKDRIEAQRRAWAEANPNTAMGAETVGALVPGVVGAFVPGGQGASVSAASMIPRVARAMAEPLTVAAERFAPSLAVRGARVLPLADEVLTGAVQSVGSADTLADAPERIAEDMPANVAGSLAVRGANAALKKRLAVRRARKGRS